MGWEYLFTIAFADAQPNAERFLQLVQTIHDSPTYQHRWPARVDIYHAQQGQQVNTLQLGAGQRGSSDTNTLAVFEQIAARYRYEPVSYQITYNLPLYIQMWEEQIPHKQPYPRRFTLREDDGGAARASMTYDAGDSRHFRSGRTRDLNLEILLQELHVIAGIGATSIRGLNIHHDQEPHRHSVVYHDDFDRYLQDIYALTGEYYPANPHNQEIVLEAIFSDDDLLVVDTPSLPILCSRGGSAGDLRSFYTRLRTLLLQDHDPAEVPEDGP